jgi:hypothetical protein
LLFVFVVVSLWLCRSIHPILAMALHGHSSAAVESGGNRTHTGRTSAHSSLVMILQILCSMGHDTNAACQRSGSAFQDTNGKARKFQDIFQDRNGRCYESPCCYESVKELRKHTSYQVPRQGTRRTRPTQHTQHKQHTHTHTSTVFYATFLVRAHCLSFFDSSSSAYVATKKPECGAVEHPRKKRI